MTTPKRPIPDYDGRPPEPTSPGDVAVWVPRVLLAPIYFPTEYLVRRPFEEFVLEVDRLGLPGKIHSLLTATSDRKVGITPVAFFEFGFRPSIGIYASWDDAFLVKGNHLHLRYEAWPKDRIAGVVQDRYQSGNKVLQIRISAVQRPDFVFYGIGPRTLQSYQSRYSKHKFDGYGMVDARLWRSSRIQATVGLRQVGVSPGHEAADLSIEVKAKTGAFDLPYGFNRRFLGPYSRLFAAFDTREPDAVFGGSGVRLEAQAEEGSDFLASPTDSWIRWGMAVSGYLDLNDHGRVLSAGVKAEFADILRGDQIPFTELVTVGGESWMHGFYEGRLVGRSAAVAQMQYFWPIGPWLGGTLQAAVGNVFSEHLEDFSPKLLRFSGAIGIATKSNPPFQVLVGMGTETFEHGAQIDAFRLSIGAPNSF